MKTYKVEIIETLKTVVEVEADSSEEAKQIVSDGWHASEYILDSEDFQGVKFVCDEKTENTTEVVEYCSLCEKENTLHCNPTEDGYISVCENCGNLMMLCSACPNLRKCDWSEAGCCKCTPELFLAFLAKRFDGETEVNVSGETVVSIFLPTGRSVLVTYKTEDLSDSDKHYEINIVCAEDECVREENPIVFSTICKNPTNVFKVVSTMKKEKGNKA